MHICLLASATSIHTQRWAEYLHGRGHQISIISRTRKDLEYAKVFAPALPDWLEKRDTLPIQVFAQFLNALSVKKKLRGIKPDVMVAFTWQSYGVIGMVSGFHPSVAGHLGMYGLSVWTRTLVGSILSKRILSYYDKQWTSDQSSKRLLLKLGCSDEKIYLNPWGVDTSVFIKEKRSSELRSTFGKGSGLVVACFRSLYPEYDVATFIKAMPIIQRIAPDTRFLVVGSGNQKNYLVQMSERLNIRNFKYIAWVKYELLPEYLASCDVYVDPINNVNRGIKMDMSGLGFTQTLPAVMSCEVAWTVTTRPGVEEIIPQEYSMFLFKRGDENQLASNVLELLGNKILRTEMGRRSREMVLQKADWRSNAKKAERMLLALAGKL